MNQGLIINTGIGLLGSNTFFSRQSSAQIIRTIRFVRCVDGGMEFWIESDQSATYLISINDPSGQIVRLIYNDNGSVTLAPDTYTFEVSDPQDQDNNTLQKIHFVVPETMKVQADVEGAGCGSSGTVRIHISGGVPPYRVRISGRTVSEQNGATYIARDLKPGTYTFSVTDSSNRVMYLSNLSQEVDRLQEKDMFAGCTVEGRFEIKEGDPPVVNIRSDNSQSCAGGVCKFIAEVAPGTGTPPFDFTWTDASGKTHKGAEWEVPCSEPFEPRSVTVTDAEQCVGTASSSGGRFSRPRGLDRSKISAFANGCNITLTIEDGVAPYTVEVFSAGTLINPKGLSPGDTPLTPAVSGNSPVVITLPLGTVDKVIVRITDSQGCWTIKVVDVKCTISPPWEGGDQALFPHGHHSGEGVSALPSHAVPRAFQSFPEPVEVMNRGTQYPSDGGIRTFSVTESVGRDSRATVKGIGHQLGNAPGITRQGMGSRACTSLHQLGNAPGITLLIRESF